MGDTSRIEAAQNIESEAADHRGTALNLRHYVQQINPRGDKTIQDLNRTLTHAARLLETRSHDLTRLARELRTDALTTPTQE